jgi:hypothetical protein
MAEITADRVYENSTTTGAGTYTLGGAVIGYRAFSAVCANGDTVRCFIEEVNTSGVATGGWEVGLYTFATAGTLARTTIEASSNAGAAVSWATGTRRIGLGITAGKLAAILKNWTESTSTASPNAISNVAALTANTASTNGDAAMVAKGNGATVAQVPDSTTNGGDKRGDRATDWQKSRSSSSMVASSSYSTVSGGQHNTASGNASTVVGGTSNTSSGINSVSGGNSNTASGVASVALGTGNTPTGQSSVGLGGGNKVDGNNSVVMGNEGWDRGVHGIRVFSSGRLFNPFDTQLREFILKAATTDATPKNLTTDNASAADTNQVTLLNGTQSFIMRGLLMARDTGNNDSWFAEFKVSVKVASGTGTVQGTPTITDQYRDSGASTWALAFTPVTSPRVLQLIVTGQAAKSIRWNCYVQSLELSNS